MSKQIQIRRGTTNANDLFVGAEGEMTMDTTTKGVRIHDGTTVGGFKIPVLVAVQHPNSTNNYTWYRKYDDGWVEQGGKNTADSGATTAVTLVVEMADSEYLPQVTQINGSTSVWNDNVRVVHGTQTTTGFDVYTGSNNSNNGFVWEVKGMAA